MPHLNYQAIIIKRINLGEADRIITAFSLENGKIKFVAKGVRRTKSKLAGSIEPFCLVNLNLSIGRNLDILTSAEIKQNYIGLSPELEKVKFCSFVGEVLDKLLPEETPVENIFHLVSNVFSSINKIDLKLLKIYFLSEIFQNLGIYPEKSVCVKCGEKPADIIYISKHAGGILDKKCCLQFADAKEININTIKLLNFSNQYSVNSLEKLKIEKANIEEALYFLEDYLKHVTGKQFKSDQI